MNNLLCIYCKESDEFSPRVGVYCGMDEEVHCEEHGVLTEDEYDVVV